MLRRIRTLPSAIASLTPAGVALFGVCVAAVELGIAAIVRTEYTVGIVWVLTGVMWLLVVAGGGRPAR